MRKKNIFKVILAILTFFVSIASSYGQCWFTELLKLTNENKVSKEYALLVTDSKKGIQSFEVAQSSGNKALLDYNNFKKFNELSSDLQEAVTKLPGEGSNSLTNQYLSEVDEGKRAGILGGEYLKDFQKLISNIDDLKNLTAAERNVLKADINSSVELKNLFISIRPSNPIFYNQM